MAGTLRDGHTYYWRAAITGFSGGGTSSMTVNTPVWSFTANAPAADDVSWAVQSADTFADAVNRAVADNGAAVTAASLNGMSDVLADGDSTPFPGLSSLDTADAAKLASDTATAVSTGSDLPSEAHALPLDDAEGEAVPTADPTATSTSTHGSVVLAGAIYGRYSWEQTNWVKHWVTNSRGAAQLRDQVKLRWIVDPGNRTS